MNPAKIRIHYANGATEERAFPPGQYRIGREAGELVLRDPNVSTNHAILTIDPGSVVITDIGSTNGTFDANGHRLTTPLALGVGQWVKLGASSLVILENASAPAGTQIMAQVPAQGAAPFAPPAAPAYQHQAYAPPAAAPYQPAYVAPPPYQQPAAVPPGYAAAAASALVHAPHPQHSPQVFQSPSGAGSAFSHPEQPIRHSYPLQASGFGISEAVGLLMKTAPYLGARLAILFGVSITGLIFWIVNIAIAMFLGNRSPLIGWIWIVMTLGAAGWFWRTVVRYFLYLLKAGHIAVLTELITKGQIGNGSEGMFSYGKRIVKARFGEISVLFAVDMIVDGVVNAFNRTLDWVSSLIPVPGLDSVVGFVKAVMRASTTYIDETIFSYNLARGDENVYRSSKDGLIYYAQNAKEILKTGVWVVILEKVLSFIIFMVIFVPALVLVSLLPFSGWGVLVQITAVIAALMFTYDVQQAVIRPLFLTMVMLKYHAVVQNQPINAEWDQRLDNVSEKFKELKGKASEWVSGTPVAGAPRHGLPA